MGSYYRVLHPVIFGVCQKSATLTEPTETLQPLQNMKDFYWLLILLLLVVGQVESVQAAPASPSGAEPRFPKPVEEYHDEQVPGIRAKLVQRIQAEPFNLVGTLRETIEEPDEGEPDRQSPAGYEGAGTCRAARSPPRLGWRLA
jgi:hypothetical protein